MNSLEEQELTHGLDSLYWPEPEPEPEAEEQLCAPTSEEPSEELAPLARSRPRGQLVRTAAPVAVVLAMLAALLVGCLRACGGAHAARRAVTSPSRPSTGNANEVPQSGVEQREVTAVANGLRASAARRSQGSKRGRQRIHGFVSSGAIKRYPLRTSAVTEVGAEPAAPWALATRIVRANARARLEFGFER